ncbi:MAG: glycosyltransferase [Acidobacteria bacterium]|nr:MAG: glycosyltransferase [Acidobacteriota bacterium]
MYTAVTSEPRIAAVIVNWNRRDDLRNLLADLHSQTESLDEILVIDNGSTDGAPEMVSREYPDVRLKRMGVNLGFITARNLGVKLVQSDFVMFLDNDIRILDTHFVSKARVSIRSHPEAGTITFWLFEKQPNDSVLGPQSPVLSFAELSKYARIGKAPVQMAPYYGRFCSGGASIIRRDVCLTIGPFCTDFPYGFEETDFAYRCLAAGIGLLVDPTLWAVHLRSPQMRLAKAPFVTSINQLIAHARYMPRFDFCLFLSASLLVHAAMAIRSRRISDVLEMWVDLAGSWRSKIAGRRRPVSRQTMRRWYFLAVHRPTVLKGVENARTSALRYYWSHIGRSIINPRRRAPVSFLGEEASPSDQSAWSS